MSELLPEPDELFLRELALKAMDGARAAGATFADVRLATARSLGLYYGWNPGGNGAQMDTPVLDRNAGYGVRAIVNGAWGFASGTDLTPDAVVETARTAVINARANRPRHRRALELAPRATVANGSWATPIAQDPFAISIQEQAALGLAAVGEAAKERKALSAWLILNWRQPLSIFASTDGSLIVQRVTLGWPEAGARGGVGSDIWSEAFARAELPAGGYGYEVLGAATLGTEIRSAAERAVALAQAARTPSSAEVGRYDIVFGPRAVAAVLTGTIAEALNAERALGYLANGAGTSFAAPPRDMLGKFPIAGSRVTVRADRSRPHGAATTGWDDEGVKADEFPLVAAGVIADYLSSRETAPQLGRGVPHGCMRGTATVRPAVQVPNLTLDPGAGAATVEDLIADTKRGFYIEDTGGGADQQVINAQFVTDHHKVRQITNGKLGGYVKELAFQFLAPQFWKNVDAVGGASSARTTHVITDYEANFDERQSFPLSSIATVPVRVRQVNVLNTGRTA